MKMRTLTLNTQPKKIPVHTQQILLMTFSFACMYNISSCNVLISINFFLIDRLKTEKQEFLSKKDEKVIAQKIYTSKRKFRIRIS